jgi:hypothetical protein
MSQSLFMSANPSSVPQPGISKSAAKKRAKKAAKAQTGAAASTTDSGIGQAAIEVEDDLVQDISDLAAAQHQAAAAASAVPGAPGSIDPSLFNFPGGGYVDIQYDSAGYYDDTEAIPPNTDPLSLPFSFDYPPPQGGAWPNGNPLAGLAPSLNITHEDLIHAANELYRRMADPEYGMEDPYWSSLTPNLRAFVREAVPINSQTRGPNGAVNQHDIHAMAQRIVKAASDGMGLGRDLRQGLLATVNGQPFQQGLGEELGFRRHPDAKEDELDEEEEYDVDESEYVAVANGDQPKKKKNKKKKKAASQDPPPAALPPPAVKQPPRQQVPQPPQPALNPPPPPTTPAPAQAPPSSRAAGKQPMTHAPAANPPRSSRAAGKAPASAPVAPAAATSKASSAKGKAPASAPAPKIWTQSSAEDRENIRQFWLGLSESERRTMLRLEKNEVLRRMKEQHRNSCGCAVCGRKKVNIEMELDSLYEQYYADLHRYAADQHAAAVGARPPPRGAGPFPGSVEVDPAGQVLKMDNLAPDPHSLAPDDLDEGSEEYEDDEEYEDEDELEDDEAVSDEAEVGEELDDTQPPPPRAVRKAPARTTAPRPEGGEDFLGFGNNLATIKGERLFFRASWLTLTLRRHSHRRR